MSITLYTAPDCLRCKIVKSFLAERALSYDTVDFKGDAPTFNTFYRTNRKAIYRNPEGVEFPLFSDGSVIKQGSGEIVAYLLSGHDLECCVTRSDLLHGWISGLYPSQCPAAQEENFVTLVNHLSKGGLQICLRADGRNPALLKRLLELKLADKVELNIPGPAAVYEHLWGAAPTQEELAESIALARTAPEHDIKLVVDPLRRADGSVSWITRDEVVAAARMLAQAADKQLPCRIGMGLEETPKDLEPLADNALVKFRSAAREFLFKIEISQ